MFQTWVQPWGGRLTVSVRNKTNTRAKDDFGLPSCQQFEVSTSWRHVLAFIRFVGLLYWLYSETSTWSLFCSADWKTCKTRSAKGLARKWKTQAEERRHATWSVGRAALLHLEQRYGKITFVLYQFRATAGRGASSADTYTGMSSCVASD